jgi:sulfur carrier protein ThiS
MSATIPVTLKLYASLGAYLPPGASRNEAELRIADGTTIAQLLEAHAVPREACHLVLLNGVFQPPAARAGVRLKPGDALAVWPPVAGG